MLCRHQTLRFYGGVATERNCLAYQTHQLNRMTTIEEVSSTNHALLVQIGKRVKLLRKAQRWTQIDMAVALDMNRGHISDIERGKREVGIITLQVIARGLGTTMSELLRRL